ncbi:406_t:CDS:2 [Cetraspora pellucida]|uniref:406_t:CDS:1 n=1 Tax=Cetraspora pellucida TaxID=1433469 RepID=A0ACA9LH95_9GLOM|nr:406_t:CDS:2 [Cetraspora pellucida]
MKQLIQKITKNEEVKMFWKVITFEKKYREQLANVRASALFKSNVFKIRKKRFAEKIDDIAQQDIKKAKLENDNENISTPSRIKFKVQTEKTENEKLYLFLTSHKLILTAYNFDIISSKVILGFKSLKSTLNIKYPEIVNEIETHKEEQRILTSLGTTLKVWLQKTLLASTPEKLYGYLKEQLQGKNITDRDKKLYKIFELTLKEFYLMIKYNSKYVLMRHNSERKFLVERVSTSFKLVEYVFGTIMTYWIKKEIMLTKATEFVDDPICEPVSKKANALVTDLTYNIDMMNMESSESFF